MVIYDIRTDSLPSEEAERVYQEAPELEAGHYDYCPTCKKTGTYRYKGVEHDCDCEMQLQLAKHYTAAGIGQKYHRISWSDLTFEPPADVQDYLKYLDAYIEQGVGLMLAGPNGAGKTMLGTLILKTIIRRGYRCYSTGSSSMVEAYTNGWSGNHEAAAWFKHKFTDSKVLLLDDLGKEFFSKIQLNVTTFDHILRTRDQNNRPTLLTTNIVNPDELFAGYGRSIMSLLVGASIWVTMDALPDFRYQMLPGVRDAVRAGEIRPIE